MNDLVSVVITSYNYGQYLPEAIESVLAQTYRDIEVIVVDDGSTDNTVEVALQYPVTLIHQPNQGVCAARNNGIRLSKGDYLLMVDADNKIDPAFIEKTIGKDDIVGTAIQMFGTENHVWHSPGGLKPGLNDFVRNNCADNGSLFRMEVWEKAGGYIRMEGYDDWYMWLRALWLGYTVTIVDEPLLLFRKHGTSMLTFAQRNHTSLYNQMMISFQQFQQEHPKLSRRMT